MFHPEKIPSVIERYETHAHRILSVVDSALEGKEWLVGNKCTYVDLSFFTWTVIFSYTYPPEDNPTNKYKNYLAWHERMASREAVRKVMATRQGMMDSEGLGADALPTDVSIDEIAEKING
jgi:glutathione S-transferase